MFKIFIVFLVLCTLANGFPFKEDANYWRIVGGENANEGEFPYQVSLRSATNSHFCGGSIISNHVILTAAHCVVGRTASNTRVVVGTIFLNSGGSTYEVSSLKPHAAYDPSMMTGDIGLVKTTSDIVTSSLVAPIPLKSEYVGVADVILSGWGTTSYPGNVPNNLQKIRLSTISHEECQARLNNRPIFDNHICTFTRAGEGACQGDSGGPLVAEGQQVGIVSWGFPCAIGYPDVFTRISSYIKWIGDNSN